jgi:PAS domain S-box-containing protein
MEATQQEGERDRLQRQLVASESRYRRLFETAKDGILILDASSGEVTDVNPFLLQLLGYTRDELLGMRLWEIGAFKNIEKSKLAFEELQNNGYIRYEDLPVMTRSGNSVAVEFVSNVYEELEKKVIQCNIRDITARKQVEQRVHLVTQALQSAANGIALTDHRGSVIWVNAAFCSMTGYTADEVLGQNPRILKSGKHPASFYDTMRLCCPASDGQLDLLLIKPEINLPCTAQLRELAEDQIDRSPDPDIGIFLHAVIRSFDVPNGHPSNQGTSLRLLEQRRVCTLAETRNFHLADRTLHAQQQSIVGESGIIHSLGVDQ